MISDVLFNTSRNETYEFVATQYHKHWSRPENLKKLVDNQITTCSICSSSGDRDKVSVLSVYYDSMPFNAVTLLDSAVVTIMALLNEDLMRDEEKLLRYIEILSPDAIRHHYFLNICELKEKTVNDWDVTEMLKSLMSSLKTNSVCLRQFANLTKLLKKECRGTCNTFLTSGKLNVMEQQETSSPMYFISDRHKYLMATKADRNNTADRLFIASTVIGIDLK